MILQDSPEWLRTNPRLSLVNCTITCLCLILASFVIIFIFFFLDIALMSTQADPVCPLNLALLPLWIFYHSLSHPWIWKHQQYCLSEQRQGWAFLMVITSLWCQKTIFLPDFSNICNTYYVCPCEKRKEGKMEGILPYSSIFAFYIVNLEKYCFY